MTTEQLKLKFIFKSGRFLCNGEKFILDVEATKDLNRERGVHLNASVVWLVGHSLDGSSTCEERSFLCAKLKEPIPGAPVQTPEQEEVVEEMIKEEESIVPEGEENNEALAGEQANEPEVETKTEPMTKPSKKVAAKKPVKKAAKKPVKKTGKKK